MERFVYSWAGARRPLRIAHVRSANFTASQAFGGMTLLQGRQFETRIPAHVHSTYVLGVIDEGIVRVTVRNEPYLAGPGSVLALQPYQAHAEYAIESPGWSFRYLYFSETVARRALGAAAKSDAVALRFAQPVLEDEQLARAVSASFDAMDAGRPPAEAEPLLAQTLMLARIRHCTPLSSSIQRSRTQAGIRMARRLILSCPRERVTITDLAGLAGVSQFHFHRLFKEEVGLPPYAYYEQVRIARAHEMILAGVAVSEAAYQLGFADQAHFTRHFHRASIFTPGQYAAISRDVGRMIAPAQARQTAE